MVKKNYRILIIFSFIVFLLLYGFNNYYLIKNYYYLPLYGDEPLHLMHAFNFYRILNDHSLSFWRKFLTFLNYRNVYPPLYYFLTAILCKFIGFSRLNATMINLIFFFIALMSIYLIAFKITANRNVGLFSVFLFSMFPLVYGMSRLYMLDFALTAIVSFTFYSLINSEEFLNKKWSIIFALSLAISCLIKWTALIFIISPFFYLFLKNIKKQPLRRLQNVLFSLLIFMVFSGLWYFKHKDHLPNLWWIKWPNPKFPFYTFKGILYYLKSFYWGISFFTFFSFIVAIFFFVRSRLKYKPVVYFWIIVPYVIFTLFDNKLARFLLPVYPALALIIAAGINEIKWLKIKKAFIIAVVFWGIIQYFLISYVPEKKIYKYAPLLSQILVPWGKEKGDYFGLHCLGEFDSLYIKEEDSTREIINILSNYAKRIQKQREFKVGVIYPASINRLRYLSLINGLKVKLYSFFTEFPSFSNNIDRFDLIISNFSGEVLDNKVEIMKGYNWIYHGAYELRNWSNIEKYLKEIKNKYVPIKIINVSPFMNLHPHVYILAKKDEVKTQNKINYVLNFLTLKRQDLWLKFNNGFVQIYKGREKLTKSDGLHILFLYKNVWYTPNSYSWNIVKHDKNSLVAVGKHLSLPISLVLKITLTSPSTVMYNIKTDIRKNFDLKEISTVLMLSDGFKYYLVPALEIRKKFPRIHKPTYKWEDLYKIDSNNLKIGAMNDKYSIFLNFCSSSYNSNYCLIISNTNTLHKARALVCAFKNFGVLSQGDFKFEISIRDKCLK